MEEVTAEPLQGSVKRQSTSQPSHLCQACLSVLTRDHLELDKSCPHHSNLTAFIEAHHSGCYICSDLCSRLDVDWLQSVAALLDGRISGDFVENTPESRATIDLWRSSGRYKDDFRGFLRWWDDSVSQFSFTEMHIEHSESFHACVSIKIRMSALNVNTILRDNLSRAREVEIEMRDWSCFILTHQDVIDLGLATTRLPSDTGSIKTWSTVEGWIQECHEQHICLAQVDTNWYPTRLVEITSSETFRIIRSDSGLFQPGPGYITLSHRWGDGEFATLTTDTLPAFERGSQINTLRKTFQDALVIAQRMGIPYIWIDSLCIIQFGDDGTDWRQESAAMAQVYSNSLCNISADWGDECNGLFFERRPQYEPPCSLEMQWGVPETEPQPGDDIESSYGVPRPLPHGVCYVVRRGGWLKDVMGSPLSSRGWVMQERLLAPRALHFSPDGIVWECGLRVASERIPSRTVDSSRTERLFWSLDPPGSGSEEHTMKRLSLRERARDTSWPDIVKQYTWCSLTKVSDKLVAIAGIAQTLSPIVKDQYVAGLWTKSLPESLAWKADKLRERRGGPTQYYAPTFSWAAADGVVEMEPFPPRGSRDIVSAVFIKYRKKNVSPLVTKQMRSGLDDSVLADDVFGPITSPEVEVRVQGILRSCRRIPQQLTLGRDGMWRSHYACPAAGLNDSEVQISFQSQTAFAIDYDRHADGVCAQEEVDLATIYYYTIIIDHQPGGMDVIRRGLLLKSVDASMGRFQRVGYLEHKHRKDNVDLSRQLGNERDLPAWSYDEETGQHTFYIV